VTAEAPAPTAPVTHSLYSRLAIFILSLSLMVFVFASLYVSKVQYQTTSALSDQVMAMTKEVALIKDEIASVRTENASFKDSDRHIAVSVSENRLYLMEGSDPIRTIRVATGTGRKIKIYGKERDFSTTPGVYAITRKETDPIWIAPDWHFFEQGETDVAKVRKIPLAERSFKGHLGKYRLVLRDGIGIHGTTEQSSIGRNASHGCIRVGDEDLKILFNSVDTATKVYIY